MNKQIDADKLIEWIDAEKHRETDGDGFETDDHIINVESLLDKILSLSKTPSSEGETVTCEDCGSSNTIALDPLTLKCKDCHYLQSLPVCEPETDFFEPKENVPYWTALYEEISQILFKGGKARHVVEHLYNSEALPKSEGFSLEDIDKIIHFGLRWHISTKHDSLTFQHDKQELIDSLSKSIQKGQEVEFAEWMARKRYCAMYEYEPFWATHIEDQDRKSTSELFQLFLKQNY